MKIAILFYLGLGVCLNFVGIISKKINNEISRIKKPNMLNSMLNKKPLPIWKMVFYEFVLRVLLIVFYPFLYLVIAIDFYNGKLKKSHPPIIQLDNILIYFHEITGTGIFQCNTCGFEEGIVGFIHEEAINSYCLSGFQCQKCGKFNVLENDMNNSQNTKCSCGGYLEREKPLFCPICKSNNNSYTAHFIT
jgi:hypothetical protein